MRSIYSSTTRAQVVCPLNRALWRDLIVASCSSKWIAVLLYNQRTIPTIGVRIAVPQSTQRISNVLVPKSFISQILLNPATARKSNVTPNVLTSRTHSRHPLKDATVGNQLVVLTFIAEIATVIGIVESDFCGVPKFGPRHLDVDPQFLASASPQPHVRCNGQPILKHSSLDRFKSNNASVSRARDIDAGANRTTYDSSAAGIASSV